MTTQTLWHILQQFSAPLAGLGGIGWILEKGYDYVMSNKKDNRTEKKQYMLELIELLTLGESSGWKTKPSPERVRNIDILANKMEKYGNDISSDLRLCANNWKLSRRTEEGEFMSDSNYYETLETYKQAAAEKGDALLKMARKHI